MTIAGLTKAPAITTFASLTMALLGGCVNVTAPSKPIEINLNIAVTQQVVLKYDQDAKTVIQQNPGIF